VSDSLEHASGERRNGPRSLVLLAAVCVMLAGALPWGQPRQPQGAVPYYPDRWSWETRKPEEVGLDSAALQEAAKFAVANEAKTHRDGEDLAAMVAGEPYNAIVGPTMTRGATSGLVIRNGYIALEWGDTNRVDWTFSATKSYVATTIGLAFDAGLIRDLNDPVVRYVQDGTFSSPHNSKITWTHLLQQSSEWQGTLWGKPDWADRYNGKDKRPVLEP
jgi:CubicO group peptidase (beta-lactamase class C family)